MGQGKILPLESLRGLAAVIVALLHFQPAPVLKEFVLIRNGGLMVDFFFVLSGFVIALNYSAKIATFGDVIAFQTKRFWRLYPLHLFLLLVFLCIEGARYITRISIHGAFEKSTLTAFWSHVFLLQSMTGHVSAFNVPSWSISTEFYTYLIFATLVLVRPAMPLILLTIVVTFCVLLYIQPAHPLDGPWFTLFPRCLYSFLIGTLAFRYGPRITQGNVVIATLCIASCIIAVCWVGNTPAEIFIPVLFAYTVGTIAMLSPDAYLHRVLSLKPLVWLGAISYSVYMIHGLVWGLVGNGLRLAVPTDVVDGVRVFHLSSGQTIGVTCASLALLLCLSHLSYRAVEIRFRRGWTHRIGAKRGHAGSAPRA